MHCVILRMSFQLPFMVFVNVPDYRRYHMLLLSWIKYKWIFQPLLFRRISRRLFSCCCFTMEQCLNYSLLHGFKSWYCHTSHYCSLQRMVWNRNVPKLPIRSTPKPIYYIPDTYALLDLVHTSVHMGGDGDQHVGICASPDNWHTCCCWCRCDKLHWWWVSVGRCRWSEDFNYNLTQSQCSVEAVC